MYIYKITNKVNSKIYIGQTISDVESRFRDHCKPSSCHTSIDKAIKKYGKDNFLVEIIDTAESIEQLNELERYYISLYNSTDKTIGYNLCEGGDNTKGYHHRPDSCEKMSKSRLGIFEGEKNPFYGKHHTEESKKKMSLAKKGKKQSKEWIENAHKPLYKPVICITTGERFESVSCAGKFYNIPANHISRACKHPTRSCKGLKFAYDNTVPSSSKATDEKV